MAATGANAVEGQTRADHFELASTQQALKRVALATSNPPARMLINEAVVVALRATQEARRKAIT